MVEQWPSKLRVVGSSPILRSKFIGEVMIHVPKGDMCARCIHIFDDCSNKDFSSMPPIEKSAMRGSGEEFIIVRCTDYVKQVD